MKTPSHTVKFNELINESNVQVFFFSVTHKKGEVTPSSRYKMILTQLSEEEGGWKKGLREEGGWGGAYSNKTGC